MERNGPRPRHPPSESSAGIAERGEVVGTDDGLISVTRDDGARWDTVRKFPGVPEQTRVSRLVLSHGDEETVYAVFDAHKDNDFRPYVLKSADLGERWTNITGNLPELGSTRGDRRTSQELESAFRGHRAERVRSGDG